MRASDLGLDQEINRYLAFRLGAELFATPLLEVREVIEFQQPTPVPNTVEHCLGVINLRGEIVGVIDLRLKLGYKRESHSNICMLVFSTKAGSMSAIVDRVEAVIDLTEKEIEKSPNIQVRIPMEYLIGMAQYKTQITTIINLHKVLLEEELTKLKNSKILNSQ